MFFKIAPKNLQDIFGNFVLARHPIWGRNSVVAFLPQILPQFVNQFHTVPFRCLVFPGDSLKNSSIGLFWNSEKFCAGIVSQVFFEILSIIQKTCINFSKKSFQDSFSLSFLLESMQKCHDFLYSLKHYTPDMLPRILRL